MKRYKLCFHGWHTGKCAVCVSEMRKALAYVSSK